MTGTAIMTIRFSNALSTDMRGRHFRDGVRGMRFLLAILASWFLLIGCGHTREPMDVLLGTWQSDPQAPSLVIAKAPNGYLGTLVFQIPFKNKTTTLAIPLSRNGDELVGTYTQTTGEVVEVVIGYDSATGRLTYRSADNPVSELSRVSDSTSVPAPSPSARSSE
jgi:hypothetical protein